MTLTDRARTRRAHIARRHDTRAEVLAATFGSRWHEVADDWGITSPRYMRPHLKCGSGAGWSIGSMPGFAWCRLDRYHAGRHELVAWDNSLWYGWGEGSGTFRVNTERMRDATGAPLYVVRTEEDATQPVSQWKSLLA